MSMKRIRAGTVATVLAALLLAGASAAAPHQGHGMMDGMDGMVGMVGMVGMGVQDTGPGMSGMGMQGMMCPGMDMMGHGMMGPGMMVELTDEQREEVRTLRRELRRQHMDAMLEIMDSREQMMEAMMAERPDPERVRELYDRAAEHQGTMLESSIAMRNRMHELLTDEQREQLQQRHRPMGRRMMQPGTGQ